MIYIHAHNARKVFIKMPEQHSFDGSHWQAGEIIVECFAEITGEKTTHKFTFSSMHKDNPEDVQLAVEIK